MAIVSANFKASMLGDGVPVHILAIDFEPARAGTESDPEGSRGHTIFLIAHPHHGFAWTPINMIEPRFEEPLG